jgi:hypothetical protein
MPTRTSEQAGDRPGFDLFFTSGPLVDWEGWSYAIGRIVIGLFDEPFEADVGSWTVVDYQRQWKEAAARLARGEGRTAFFTSYKGVGAAWHAWWPAWREEGMVRLQHHLLLRDQLTDPFDIREPYRHISERRGVSEDGEAISEWAVGIEDVLAFASRPVTGR